MPFRLMPALCVVLLAGCTSSEPQTNTDLPLAATTSIMPPAPPAPAVYHPVGEFPPQAPAPVASPAALGQPAPRCSTVDGVTLCDASTETDTYDDTDQTTYTN